MTSLELSSSDFPSDITFRHYNRSQATTYAAFRDSYPSELYEKVFQYHIETDGRFDTLLDVGCGPGNATRDLAQSFREVTGIDPGAEMINVARQLGGMTKSGQPIQFLVAPAEKCASIGGIENGIDILTSAMAVSEKGARIIVDRPRSSNCKT